MTALLLAAKVLVLILAAVACRALYEAAETLDELGRKR